MNEQNGTDRPAEAQDASPQDLPVGTATKHRRTPMFEAYNSARYERQGQVRRIQEKTGRRLICYVSGAAASIDRDDTLGFIDLLDATVKGTELDLLLHTPGGDIDAAEKLVSMMRSRVGNGRLRIIVPDFAKSAGTLMAIGADAIVMSDTSELGPIDPQITLSDGHGNMIRHSVQSYLDAYEAHAASLRADPNDVVARLMLTRIDPATVKLFEAARGRARQLAENHLKRGMFRSDGEAPNGNFSKIAASLIDTKQWQTHGQVIGWEDAKGMGLTVEHLAPGDEPWRLFWRLYCHQRLAIKDGQKLFESDYASLLVDAAR